MGYPIKKKVMSSSSSLFLDDCYCSGEAEAERRSGGWSRANRTMIGSIVSATSKILVNNDDWKRNWQDGAANC